MCVLACVRVHDGLSHESHLGIQESTISQCQHNVVRQQRGQLTSTELPNSPGYQQQAIEATFLPHSDNMPEKHTYTHIWIFCPCLHDNIKSCFLIIQTKQRVHRSTNNPVADPVSWTSQVTYGKKHLLIFFFPQALATVGHHLSRKESIQHNPGHAAPLSPAGILYLYIFTVFASFLFAEGHEEWCSLLNVFITVVKAILSERTEAPPSMVTKVIKHNKHGRCPVVIYRMV